MTFFSNVVIYFCFSVGIQPCQANLNHFLLRILLRILRELHHGKVTKYWRLQSRHKSIYNYYNNTMFLHLGFLMQEGLVLPF